MKIVYYETENGNIVFWVDEDISGELMRHLHSKGINAASKPDAAHNVRITLAESIGKVQDCLSDFSG